MKILAIEIESPGTDPGQFQPHLKSEAARIWQLNQSNLLREIYFRTDRSTAILVFECVDIAEAQAAVDSLPLVQQGLIRFELIPLKPYPGFSRLFAE